MHLRSTRRSFTRTEALAVLLVILVTVVVVIVMLDPTSWTRPSIARARSIKDASQLRAVHRSWIVATREFNTAAPLPSLVVAALNDTAEDFSLNHSANIYSLLVIRHYLTPAMLISPLEVSDHITEADYNFNAYDPLDGVYWDPSFVMHIEDPSIGANGSYAHIAAVGDRRDALDPAKSSHDMPILGTRGPDVTNLDPAEYHRSPTYRFSKPYDQWIGSIVFADNHGETLNTFYPQLTAYQSPGSDRAIKDNIFSADFDHPNGPQAAADAFLCICTGATQFTVDDVYDPLLDD